MKCPACGTELRASLTQPGRLWACIASDGGCSRLWSNISLQQIGPIIDFDNKHEIVDLNPPIDWKDIAKLNED